MYCKNSASFLDISLTLSDAKREKYLIEGRRKQIEELRQRLAEEEKILFACISYV